MTKKLYKTIIEIWTEFNPNPLTNAELVNCPKKYHMKQDVYETDESSVTDELGFPTLPNMGKHG